MTPSFVDRLEAAIASGAGTSEVLVLCLSRLRTLARRMLAENPQLRCLHDTDDLMQNVAIRLHRALGEVSVQTPHHAMGLAVMHLKRHVIDLVRGLSHLEPHPLDPAVTGRLETHDELLHAWGAFHEAVDALQPHQREAVHFLWYLGLDQEDAARLLGITSRTLRRHWNEARDALRSRLDAHDFRMPD